MSSVEQFLNELGGTSAVARAMGLAPTTVSSWKASGSIPNWRLGRLVELAAQKGVAVPPITNKRDKVA